MKLDIPDEYIPLVINALEHYHAYTHAVNRDDKRYLEIAELLKRKEPGKAEPERVGKKKRA